MNQTELIKYFQEINNRLNKAYIANDPAGVGKCLSDNWVMLEPEFGIVNKEKFLQAIKVGELSHTQMEKEVLHVNDFDDTVIVNIG